MLTYVKTILRFFFFAVIVRFFLLIIIGINVRNRDKLPNKGPAIIVANHNSHLDTLVLINLLPIKLLPKIRPVAAADYFLRNKLLAWFAINIMGIIPILRDSAKKNVDPLAPCYRALDNHDILILFPEGTRGQPERLSTFKKGIAYLANQYHKVPVIPIFMHGLGKTLPKGEYLLVPFFCDVFVGNAIYGKHDKADFMKMLNDEFEQLTQEGSFAPWQ